MKNPPGNGIGNIRAAAAAVIVEPPENDHFPNIAL